MNNSSIIMDFQRYTYLHKKSLYLKWVRVYLVLGNWPGPCSARSATLFYRGTLDLWNTWTLVYSTLTTLLVRNLFIVQRYGSVSHLESLLIFIILSVALITSMQKNSLVVITVEIETGVYFFELYVFFCASWLI